MISCAWLWIYVGLGLILMELVLPGFIMCFFGLGAVSVGVCRFVFGAGFDATWQLAAFTFFSVVYIIALRRFFRRSFTGSRQADCDLGGDYVGRTGRVTAAIEPPLQGRVMLGDSEWNAEADQPVPVDTEVKVISRNNLTMKVEVLKK